MFYHSSFYQYIYLFSQRSYIKINRITHYPNKVCKSIYTDDVFLQHYQQGSPILYNFPCLLPLYQHVPYYSSPYILPEPYFYLLSFTLTDVPNQNLISQVNRFRRTISRSISWQEDLKHTVWFQFNFQILVGFELSCHL